jgi:deaminated glutathione amidase
VLARHDDEPGIALALLTQRALDEARNRLPVLEHRRIATPSDVR